MALKIKVTPSSASSPEDADKLQIMLRDIEEVLEK